MNSTGDNAIIKCRNPLPVEIVFHPSWWYKNTGITFDRDFFFDPLRRVEAERRMEQELYDRFGQYGLGTDRDKNLPQIGAVHNATGFLVSGMLGCDLNFKDDAPPEVIPAELDTLDVSKIGNAFKSPWFKCFDRMCQSLKKSYGYLVGDVNWGGVLNIALDLRGQMLFIDMFDKPKELKNYFHAIAGVSERFASSIQSETGSSSISVNRTVRHFDKPVFLHSECSVTMISTEQYEEFIFPYDFQWSQMHRPFGIHFCGSDSHRFAAGFAKLPHLDFLDVGWGGDLAELRRHLPDTFLNIRISPVEIARQSTGEIENTIRKLAKASGNPQLTGICCINMDDQITDEKICAIFNTAREIRK